MTKKYDIFDSINLDLLKVYNERNEKVSDYFQTSSKNKHLCGLSRVNIFIGANNSGKSRLLRSLFTSISLRGNPQQQSLKKVIEPNKRFIEEYKPQIFNRGYRDHDRAFQSFENFVHEQELGCYHSNGIQVSYKAVEGNIQALYSAIQNIEQFDTKRWRRQMLEDLFTANRIADQDVTQSKLPTKSVFIPILRSLKISGANNALSSKTKSDYFADGDFDNLNGPNMVVFDGTAIYEDLKNRLLTSSSNRKTVTDYEIFLSENFFDNQTVQLSPNPRDSTLHIKIGTQQDRKIQDLGDGIQSIIIISYSGYFLDSPSRIHVEEPELYLHPGMQRRLLEVINTDDYLSRHQWFFTTHSNHLLDTSIDFPTSIFKVEAIEQKDPENKLQSKITHLPKPNLGVLSDLGIQASSVFRANSILWVEGVTDRLYIKSMLQTYCRITSQREPRQDIDFTIMEYGGGNVVHFNFTDTEDSSLMNTKYLSEKSFIIYDGDNLEKKKRANYFKQIPENRRYAIPGKEIENILSVNIIIDICVEKITNSNLEAHEKEKALGNLNAETLLSKMELKMSSKKGLGKILDEVTKVKYFEIDSGTIKDKVDFCQSYISLLANIHASANPKIDEVLTPQAQELCKAIIKFCTNKL